MNHIHPCFSPLEQMAVKDIQDCINSLLFDERAQMELGATDRELLTIVVVESKAQHFNFLQGYTSWKTIGSWLGPGGKVAREHNVQIDIEFKDSPDEKVGKRLIDLLREYNKQVVKEQLLYARTAPLEEGTL